MSLVDSSVWIEFFRQTGSVAHERLKALLSSDDVLLTTEPVAMELLAGAQDARRRQRIRRTLAACRFVRVDGASDWEAAAGIFLACRRSGSTPRQLMDCLIAAVAIRTGVPVLAQDRDYELIAEHTALELAA